MSALEPPPGGVRYLIWLFEPGPAREGLAALFAIEREIEDSARPGLEPSVGQARLDWWSEECALLCASRPRHPATRALAAAIGGDVGALPDLRPLVEATRWRHARRACESRAQLDGLLDQWAATVFAATVLLGGAQLATDAVHARRSFALRAGRAVREIELLSQLRTLAQHGLLYLPLDDLAATGGSHEAVRDQPYPAAIAALLRARFTACTQTLRDAAHALAQPDRITARSALLWIAQTLRLARRAAAALPMEYAAPRLAPLSELFAAWNAARRCLRGQLPHLP